MLTQRAALGGILLGLLAGCGGGGGGSSAAPSTPTESPSPLPEPLSPFSTGPHACTDGFAGEFPCSGVSLRKRVDYASIGGTFSQVVDPGSDIWGWVDPQTGNEYALVALSDGTAFVDVSDPEDPAFLGKLPTRTSDSGERDVKVYRDHAYIVGGAARHGMQVFDLTRLRDVVRAQEFSADVEYRDFGEAKNIAINEETGFAYAVRTDRCGGGLHIIDIRTPNNPMFAGCHSLGSTLDAQCVVYRGPDTDHANQEICFSSNASYLEIVDVSMANSTSRISTASGEGIALYHQGWLTEDQRFFLLDDELDESGSNVPTRTHIFDVTDLDAPVYVGAHEAETSATDHNLFILGDLVFEANFAAGLRVLALGDLASLELTEVAYFDTAPDSDATGWGVGTASIYPFFPSGTIVAVDQSGLFIFTME